MESDFRRVEAKVNKNYNIMILRVLACLGVFVTHLNQIATFPAVISKAFVFGMYGVFLFFIMSGYLAYDSYGKYKKVCDYYKNRIFRILPLYYLIILWYVFFFECLLKNRGVPVPEDIYGMGWGRYFLLFSFCVPGDPFWTNLGMTWTISCFMLFYLLMPLIHKYVKTFSSVCLAIAVSLVVKTILPDGWLQPLCQLYFFLLGVTINIAIKESKESIYVVLQLVILICLVIYAPLNYPMIFGSILSIVFVCACRNQSGSLQKVHWLNRGIEWIDKNSFEIYLFHPIVMYFIQYYVIDTRYDVNLYKILIYIIGTILIVELKSGVVKIFGTCFGAKYN